MGELTPQERLQPSLLDRLTDEEPGNPRESREQRVLSLRRLREIALRDLAWLLNTTNLAASEELDDYPHVVNSVLNYGIPDLTGVSAARLDAYRLQAAVHEAITRFEPRILPGTLSVRVLAAPREMNRSALTFIIEGELWAQPIPLQLFLKTELDLETGHMYLQESAANAAATPGEIKRGER